MMHFIGSSVLSLHRRNGSANLLLYRLDKTAAFSDFDARKLFYPLVQL